MSNVIATRTFGAFTFNFTNVSGQEAAIELVYRGEVMHTSHFAVKGDKDVVELLSNLEGKDEIFLAANTFQEWMEACQLMRALPAEMLELFGAVDKVVLPFDTESEDDARFVEFKRDADEFLAMMTELLEG